MQNSNWIRTYVNFAIQYCYCCPFCIYCPLRIFFFWKKVAVTWLFVLISFNCTNPQSLGVSIIEDGGSGVTMELEMQWDANSSIILAIKTRLGVALPVQVIHTCVFASVYYYLLFQDFFLYIILKPVQASIQLNSGLIKH